MSYSDTQKVAKCCLYDRVDVKKKKKKKKGGGGNILKTKKREQHRVLSTSTCVFNNNLYIHKIK